MNKTLTLALALALALALTLALTVPKCEGQQRYPITRDYYRYPIKLDYYRYNHHPHYYRHKIGIYGGPNYYRRAWTNYRSPNTSFGYRTHYPTAKGLGITAPHKYGNQNPRSLYR